MPQVKRIFSILTNRPYWQFYTLGVVLLLVSGYLWWTQIYLNPQRVFWGMIDNNLSTSGVTMEVSQKSGQSEIKQLIQMELGDTNRAHSLTTLKQGKTEVKTEIIGTKDTDYTRYRSIKTDQKNASGQPLNTAKVVDVWAKSAAVEQSPTQASGNQLFSQAVLGIGLPVGSVPVPIGKLSAQQREKLMQFIRNDTVYQTSFKNVKKERKDGRLLYTYDVKIQTILYVRLMKEFAKNVGLHELDQVDPNMYQSAEPLSVKLTVDAQSRQLAGVESSQGGYRQSYKGYGLPLDVALPTKTITTDELTQRLSEL